MACSATTAIGLKAVGQADQQWPGAVRRIVGIAEGFGAGSIRLDTARADRPLLWGQAADGFQELPESIQFKLLGHLDR